jgi:hypothetical protein
MNRILKTVFFITILLCLSCNDKEPNKTYLAKYVDSLKVEHNLSENPRILFDGVPIEYENMNDGWFLIKKEDISSLKYIKKGETKIYGSKDINGVVLVTTMLSERQRAIDKSEKKTLYVLDGEIILLAEYKKIDQSKVIGTATIIEQSAIKEFTSDKYDELIYVTTKMPTE